MSLFISHESAIVYWREAARVGKRPPAVRISSLAKSVNTRQGLQGYNLRPFIAPDGMVHVLVPARCAGSRVAGISFVQWGGWLPGQSFCKIGEGVYVASPEFTFLLMCGKLDLTDCILLGMMMCGTYDLPPSPLVKPKKVSITTVEKLRSFVMRAGSVYGSRKAIEALKWVVNGSASFPETSIMLQLCLPHRLGGYALPLPVMNRFYALSGGQARKAKARHQANDLYWHDFALAVEYDSAAHHDGPAGIQKDQDRRNALLDRGIRVYVVSGSTLADTGRMAYLAEYLAAAMGKRIRIKSTKFIVARGNLRYRLNPEYLTSSLFS